MDISYQVLLLKPPPSLLVLLPTHPPTHTYQVNPPGYRTPGFPTPLLLLLFFHKRMDRRTERGYNHYLYKRTTRPGCKATYLSLPFRLRISNPFFPFLQALLTYFVGSYELFRGNTYLLRATLFIALFPSYPNPEKRNRDSSLLRFTNIYSIRPCLTTTI